MTRNEKRRVILTREQEEKIAKQSADQIQAFCNELAQVRSRKMDMLGLIVSAQIQYGGVDSVEIEKVRALAAKLVDADGREKWEELKKLFVEKGVQGPQPHLEWAAAKLGVKLFDEQGLIVAPTVEITEGEAIQ